MDLTLRHLRYVIALADHRHFGRAASAVGIAQPPFSAQIRLLERQLDTPLFVRSRQGTSPTPAGQVLVEGARKILNDLRRVTSAVHQVAKGQVGSVRVCYPGSALYGVVPRVIAHFRRVHSGIAVDLMEAPSAEHAELLRTGRADIAFSRDPEEAAGVICHRLTSEELVAALPKGHRLASRRRIRPRELSSDPFVLFARSAHPVLYDSILSLCRGDGFSPQIMQESQQWLTVLALVRAGLGVSLVPASFAAASGGDIFYVRLRGSSRTVLSVCRMDVPLASPITQFLGAAREVMAAVEKESGRRSAGR
jgi:DNA-binding transcriptional LysR family regulator